MSSRNTLSQAIVIDLVYINDRHVHPPPSLPPRLSAPITYPQPDPIILLHRRDSCTAPLSLTVLISTESLYNVLVVEHQQSTAGRTNNFFCKLQLQRLMVHQHIEDFAVLQPACDEHECEASPTRQEEKMGQRPSLSSHIQDILRCLKHPERMGKKSRDIMRLKRKQKRETFTFHSFRL